MALTLMIHPDSTAPSVRSIEVEVNRPRPDRLALRYRLTGNLSHLIYPPPHTPARANNLWRHTCFEAFIGQPGGAYLEFNLSPSREWAAYRFDSYRHGVSQPEIADPHIAISTQSGLVLSAELQIPVDAFHLGLAAVIEDRTNTTSYWALAHAPGKPDFHNPDCFAAELPAVERP
jgi:hypothetical protein